MNVTPRMIVNPNLDIVKSIKDALKRNDGYCPCITERTEDTKCPCKDFREHKKCHCSLYVENTNVIKHEQLLNRFDELSKEIQVLIKDITDQTYNYGTEDYVYFEDNRFRKLAFDIAMLHGQLSVIQTLGQIDISH